MRAADVWLASHVAPPEKRRIATDILVLQPNGTVLIPDDDHKDGHFFSLPLEPHERAVIVAIRIKFARNPFNQPIRLRFVRVFDPNEAKQKTHHHPDFTGQMDFVIPAHANGVVPEQDKLIYQPNIVNLSNGKLLRFAGMEHAILGAHSTVVAKMDGSKKESEVLFHPTDPFVVFMMEERNTLFQAPLMFSARLVQAGAGDPMYAIPKSLVEHAQTIFRDGIFPLFRYCSQKHIPIEWDALEKPVAQQKTPLNNPFQLETVVTPFVCAVIQLELEYMVVARRTPMCQISFATLRETGRVK